MTKKKIIIIIIAIILVVAISLLLIFIKNRSVKVSNYDEDKTTNLPNNETNNVIANTNVIENDLLTNTINTTNSSAENIESSIETPKSDTQKTTNDKKVEVTTKATTQKQTQTSSKETKNPTLQVPKEETPSTPQVPPTSSHQQQVPVEEYKRNDTMINKIKQVIQNNATDNMKNFGYNIVVDSSIKNQTNQFTFTENRVINAIRSKFGTIKIYAEDFYKNGQLVMTECYIL